jgi:hypothetical protein
MTPERFATLKDRLDRRQPDLTVLMDNVHKSHNISAVIRTCDTVGISKRMPCRPMAACGGTIIHRPARGVT